MKYCPVCYAEFPDEYASCPTDNVALRTTAGWRPGDVIRKYRIIEKIGEGGMGSVYKAQHITFEELRALKVMHASLAADPKFVRRFLREAKTARRLHHPNTCAVEDIDQADDGSLFIAMEYIDGPQLGALIREQGPLPVDRAMAITRSLASALHSAHSMGIIHRDIKPANILMSCDANGNDLPKLVDFGIVALQDNSGTTMTSQLMLTPTYAAPEQFQLASDQIDGRADLYALGFVLFEMLTGRLPIEASTPTAWMMAKIHQPMPPPSQFNAALASMPRVDQIVGKLIAGDRDQRFPDAGVLVAILDASGLLPAGIEFPEITAAPPGRGAPASRIPGSTGPATGRASWTQNVPPSGVPTPAPAPTYYPPSQQAAVSQPTPMEPVATALPPSPWPRRALYAAPLLLLLLLVAIFYPRGSESGAGTAANAPQASESPSDPVAPPAPPPPPTESAGSASPAAVPPSAQPKLPPSQPPPGQTQQSQTPPAPAPPAPVPTPVQTATQPPAPPAAVPSPPEQRIPVGDPQGGRIIRRTPAVYPEAARRQGVQGTVSFTALIGKDGVVKSLTLVNGHPLLVPAAEEALKTWLFQPSYVNGQPVEFTSHLSMSFSIQ